MGLFNKSVSLASLLQKLQQRQFQTGGELDQILEQIATHDDFKDLKPRQMLSFLTDANPKVRVWSAAQLDRLTQGNALATLVEAMVGADPRTRGELAKEAAKCPIPDLVRVIGPMVHNREAGPRETALDVIGAHPRPAEFTSFLKTALRWPESALRQRAARFLGRVADDPTIRLVLLDMVHDGDDAVRREVIFALAAKPGADLVEPFFSRLQEETRDTQSAMIAALSRLAQSQTAHLEDRLLPILAHEDARMRDVAVRLLAEMPNRKQVLRSFLVHCRGIASWLRERTAASMQSISRDLVEPLLELMQDPEDDIKVSAMVMASDCKDERVVPVVTRIFLSSCDWWIRSIAADALARFQNDQVVQILLSRLDDPDLCFSVITALGTMQTPAVVPHLLGCLRDPERGVRMITLEALRNRPSSDVAAAVFELACNDPERRVREKAADILTSLGGVAEGFLAQLEERLQRTLQRQAQDTGNDLGVDLAMENDALNKRS